MTALGGPLLCGSRKRREKNYLRKEKKEKKAKALRQFHTRRGKGKAKR